MNLRDYRDYEYYNNYDYRKSKRTFGCLSIIAVSLIIALIVGALGYLSSGFKDWNTKGWFDEFKNTEATETISLQMSSQRLNGWFGDDVQTIDSYDYGTVYIEIYVKDNIPTLGLIRKSSSPFCKFYIDVTAMGQNLVNLRWGDFAGDTNLINLNVVTNTQNNPFNMSLASIMASKPLTKDITYNFKFTFTFAEAEPAYPKTQTLNYRFTTLPADPTRTGYTFDGWYLDSALTQRFNGSVIYGNISLYPKWNINTYTITYSLNGGTLSGQETSYNVETADITLKTPTKNGYTFDGWYDNAAFSGSVITKITKGSTGNKTFYAKWNINTYTITYNVNDGVLSGQETSYNVETADITLKVPTKNGYSFGGWFDNSGFTGSAVTKITKGSTGNKTFYAKWNINIYTVTFDSSGGSAVTAVSVNHGSTVTLPTAPTRTGYNFLGWFIDETIYTNQSITSNTTLTARWEIKIFTVTFMNHDGTVYCEMSVPYGTLLQELEAEVQTLSIETISFKNANIEIDPDANALAIVDNAVIIANEKTGIDKAIGEVKANYKTILGGIMGVILLVVVVSAVSSLSKKRRKTARG